MPRYKSSRIINNNIEFYEFLRKKRGVKNIRQYGTPRMRNPGVADRNFAQTTAHIWVYGDRYYKLADQYYGLADYWWVIAWWNGRPTEAGIQHGTAIEIPTNLEQALTILGAY